MKFFNNVSTITNWIQDTGRYVFIIDLAKICDVLQAESLNLSLIGTDG